MSTWQGAHHRPRQHRRGSEGVRAGDRLLQMLQPPAPRPFSPRRALGPPRGSSSDSLASSAGDRGPGWPQAPSGYGMGKGGGKCGPCGPAAGPFSAEGNSLRDLLAQVAPQARFHESASQLTTRASARILGRVLDASNCSSSRQQSGYDRPVPAEAAAAPSAQFPPPPAEAAARQRGEEDDDYEFQQRWKDLFGEGSPLVSGTVRNPFKEDLRRRVVWKKNNQRPGHHSRYQQRRQERARKDAVLVTQEDEESATNSTDETSEDETVSLRYDACKSSASSAALS